MTAAELAALIAAVCWALLVGVGGFVLFRLARLLSESSRLVADLRERGDVLLQRAQAVRQAYRRGDGRPGQGNRPLHARCARGDGAVYDSAFPAARPYPRH